MNGAAATYTYGFDRVTQQKVTGASGPVPKYAYGYDYQTNVSAVGAYDANGWNVTKPLCFRHDAFGRLTGVGTTWGFYPDSIACTSDREVMQFIARYKYDHLGRRIARWLASTGEWTYFAHDPGGSPLSEMKMPSTSGGAWSRQRDYVWLEGKPLAQIETAGGSSYAYYFHLDQLGLPRALTNQSGQTVWSASTRPYGDIVETTSTDPLSGRTVVTNLRLPGQYDERLLAAAGISWLQGPCYNWNRWYLPSVGRYLELDPVALRGGFNEEFGPDWYNYGSGNPLSHIDPTGEFDNGSCPGCEDTCCCAAVKYGPDACPGAPPPKPNPKPKPKPKPKPDCDPVPSPPPPPGNGCKCTCLGTADPNWNPDDKHHGDRDVGMVWFDADCRAECRTRGFAPEQYQCPKTGR